MTNGILKSILSTKTDIALCWLGNLSWLICADDCLVAFDLDLGQGSRIQKSPIPMEEIAMVLDVHLITHEHEDHFNSATCGVLAERSNCLVFGQHLTASHSSHSS